MTKEEIQKLIDDALKAAQAAQSKGLTEAVAAALKAALPEAIKPVTEATTALAAKVEAIEKAKTEPAPDDKNKPKPGETDPKALAAAVKELLAPELKLVKDMHDEREAEKGQQSTKARVGAWLDKNRPNLPKPAREALERRLIAIAPKDDAATEAAFGAEVEHVKAMGVDTKPYMADFAGEGGKPGAGGGDDMKAKEAESIKNIEAGGRPGKL